jgi:CRP-like cAMP-binding protein
MNNVLLQCILFNGLELEEISNLHKEIWKENKYLKDEIIAFEEEECKAIGIILYGKAEIKKIYPTGKTVTMTILGEGDIFGEAVMFSDSGYYPATVYAATDCKILFLNKQSLIDLFKNELILNNYLKMLSNKILFLNNKIKYLSSHTIKESICNMILEEYKKQKSNTIVLPYSKNKIAELLGVQRPSLSREFINLQNSGLIKFYKNIVKIIDLKGIEDILI